MVQKHAKRAVLLAVLLARVWRDKVLRDHAELDGYLPDVLRAASVPDHVEPDPVYEHRTRFHLRGAGPSRWLLVGRKL